MKAQLVMVLPIRFQFTFNRMFLKPYTSAVSDHLIADGVILFSILVYLSKRKAPGGCKGTE